MTQPPRRTKRTAVASVERWTEPPGYRSIKPSSPPRVVNQARRIGTDDPHTRIPAQCLHGARQLVGALCPTVDERHAHRWAIKSNDKPGYACP